MILIDAHLDLAFQAVAMGAELRLELDALRASPFGQAASARGETPAVSLPALREADVRLLFGTIFVLPADTPIAGPVYRTAEEANRQGWAQMEYYQELATQGEITLVGTTADLERALAGEVPLPGVVPLMEGADPVLEIEELARWYEAGVRIIGPAWTATRYCGGTRAPGPLTPAGRDLMRAMSEQGLILDTSHMAEESFWEALDLFEGPVIASHSNCRALVPTDRHLSDDMIRAICERGGMIGVVLYNRFLLPDWTPTQGKESVPLEAVVRQIEHLCEVAGDSRHIGIGSDFDGGFGVEGMPAGLDSSRDLPRLGEALLAAGWGQEEVAGILGENWARWLRGALPASASLLPRT